MPFDDIRAARLAKLQQLKENGIDPYPATSWRTHSVHDILEKFDTLADEKHNVVIAGRVMARREHGGSTFLDLMDGTASMQVFLKRDLLGERVYDLLADTLDIGDFLEVYGSLFRTKKEERTVQAERATILTKTLRPLPEKWHGLQDTEERFRRRYLDLVFNPDVREKFILRSRIIQSIRDFMNEHEFLEVQTPTLQPLYGGASARPFKTHMHALDMDLYLRIAPELYLKRLLVGGLPAVYEFTTNFRNEGMDRDHNPEFSAMEFYAAYRDLEWAMQFTERMFGAMLTKVFATTTITYDGTPIHFHSPFVRATFNELLKQYAGVDYDYVDEATLLAKVRELGGTADAAQGKAGLADELFKKTVRGKLIEPTFVTEYPAEMLPLAKRLANPEYVGAFQFYAGGFELIKAFSELNDPIDQRARFTAQESKRAKGDEEAQRLDEDFVEALEYGMPPAAGWGLGIDRLVALLTGSHSLREVILFPTMKPKSD